jgi:hypothetical protein
VDTFIGEFEKANLVADGSLSDQFLLSLSLLYCIRRGPLIEQARAVYFIEKVLNIVRKQFDRFIESFVAGILPIGEEILDQGEDESVKLGKSLQERVKVLFNSFCFPSQLEELCITHLVTVFDAKIVGMIWTVPGRCNLSHAIRWNTTVTIADTDCHLTLAFLRQAATVIQGAMLLCTDPSLKDEMVPELPPGVVLKLLKAKVPDEFDPMENDTTGFAAHFKITDDSEPVVPVTYSGQFEGLDEVISCDWNVKRFRPDQIQGFEYLSEFLA